MPRPRPLPADTAVPSGTGSDRPPGPVADGGDDLAGLFWAAAREMRHRTRDALEPFDITPSQSRALVTLMRAGPLRLSALSERLHIAPRSATEVVDALEDRGFAARRADPDDRRATLVEVTDAGRDAAKTVRAAWLADENTFLTARLDAGQREQLASLLRTLLRG